MLGKELRPIETLRTGKAHYRHVEVTVSVLQSMSLGIIYHLSSILMRSFQPSSVGQPTSSLVPFSHFSTLVLSGKTSNVGWEMFSSDS